MRISDKKLKLKVPSNKYMPSIIDEIRHNLSKMGVSGLTIDCRYDVKLNVAMCRFSFHTKNYEMKVSNQRDVRCNMWAINKRIEYKVRMHLLDIEPFELSISTYIQLEDQREDKSSYVEPEKASPKSYAVLGLPQYASNEDIIHRYKELMKSFHPDMALSDEAKREFEKKCAEINEAYTQIKNEREL